MVPKTVVKILGKLEHLDAVELKQKCEEVGLSSIGSKNELVVWLTLLHTLTNRASCWPVPSRNFGSERVERTNIKSRTQSCQRCYRQ
jgi:hypothetical protein